MKALTSPAAAVAVLLLITALVINALPLHSATHSSNTSSKAVKESVESIVSKMLSNPKAFIAIAIQFILGFALGYYSAKVIKYLLALIGIIVLGSVLSVWSIGGNINEFLSKVSSEAVKLWPVIQGFMATFGIMTIVPVTVGFILGAIAAFARK